MSEPLTARIFGRRRNFLVNTPYQHRLSMLTTLLALVPPAIFFGIYYMITAEGSRRIVEASPSLAPLVRGQDRSESLLILAAVLFYGLGVYLVSMMESHRTAGFMHRLELRMKEIQEGYYGGSLNPRKDDNFTYLAATLNHLSRTLHARAEDDLALLEEIGASVDVALPRVEGSAMVEALGTARGRIQALCSLKRSHMEQPGAARVGTFPTLSDQPQAAAAATAADHPPL